MKSIIQSLIVLLAFIIIMLSITEKNKVSDEILIYESSPKTDIADSNKETN